MGILLLLSSTCGMRISWCMIAYDGVNLAAAASDDGGVGGGSSVWRCCAADDEPSGDDHGLSLPRPDTGTWLRQEAFL